MNETNIVERWLSKSAEDLGNAKFLFENRHPQPFELICHLSQQSAEKALKAHIVHNKEEPPHTHEMGTLCRICGKFNDFSAIERICVDLTLYANLCLYGQKVSTSSAISLSH